MTSDQSVARFVILEHDHPFLHWDLLLQDGETLKAWRLLSQIAPGTWISSQSLPEHRLMYLDYEGPVSGNRGNVTRVCGGTYRLRIHDHGESTFDLIDCPLAAQVRCRRYGSPEPEWCFE